MIPPAIVAVLRQKIGLHPDTISTRALHNAIRQRMARCGLNDMPAYVERVQTSRREWCALAEEVVVPETWFFRDQLPFTYLGQYVMAEWMPKHPVDELRVLSLACSTGEEPYSIVMGLLDTGMALGRIHIDAIDISNKALQVAQRGVYGNRSFRGDDVAFRDRYFTPHPDGYKLDDQVRQRVTFRQGNILEPDVFSGTPTYHVVFCRNMLIYFDDPARTHACDVLHRLLASSGVLFVGYAETGLFLTSAYLPVRYPRAFAFRNATQLQAEQPAPQRPAQTRSHLRQRHLHDGPCEPQPVADVSVPAAPLQEPVASHVAPVSTLDEARQLADQGDLQAAAALCEAHVRDHGPGAQADVLLGLIHQAAGRLEQAAQGFNRALYLEPDHYEALVHLALLAEHRGDTAGAALLRQRAQRVHSRTE